VGHDVPVGTLRPEDRYALPLSDHNGAGLMPPNFKTSADVARAMAQQWYQMAGRDADQAGLDHWTDEIQHDGSHTAFGNFSKGIAKDTPQAAAMLQSNANKLKQTEGVDPWQPDKNTPQLAGTNTKNLGGVLDANESWLKPLAEGALSFVPGVGPALSAGVGAAWNYSHNHDLGKAALEGGLTYGGGKLLSGLGGKLGVPTGWTDNLGKLMPGGFAGGGGGDTTPNAPASSGGNWYDGLLDAGKKLVSGMTLDKAGSAISSGIDSYNKNRQTSSEIENRAKMTKLAQDQQVMNDQQFAAKYGMDKAAAKDSMDKFNANFGLTAAKDASAAQARNNTAPMRDQAQFMLQKLVGGQMAPFKGRDLYAGGADALKTPGTGGALDFAANRNAAAGMYKAGMGGVKTDVDQGIVDRYANAKPIATNDPGTYTPPKGTGYKPPVVPPVTPPATPPVTPPPVTPPVTPPPVTPPPVTPAAVSGVTGDEDPMEKAKRFLMARLGTTGATNGIRGQDGNYGEGYGSDGSPNRSNRVME